MGFLKQILTWLSMLMALLSFFGCSIHGSGTLAFMDGVVKVTPRYDVVVDVDVLGFPIPKVFDLEWPAPTKTTMTNEQFDRYVRLLEERHRTFTKEQIHKMGVPKEPLLLAIVTP